MVEMLEGRFKPFHLLTAAFIVSGLAVVYAAWNLPMVWDSSIYVAMGKALYTLGRAGFWEVYRPPVLPLILGTVWKLGLPPGSHRVVSVMLSAATVSIVYSFSDKIESKTAAIVAAGGLASSYTFMYFTANPLTGILASGLILATLYFILRGKYGTAGVVAGAAFLTRFPSALVLPAAGLWTLLRLWRGEQRPGEAVENGSVLAVGFLAVVFPYLAIAQIVYGSFLEPFTTGYSVTAAAGSSFMFGLKYLWISVKNQPLFLLAVPGVVISALRGKDSDLLILSALAVFYGFFTYFPLKIERYSLVFLPLIAFFAGLTASRAVEEARKRREISYPVNCVLAVFAVVAIAVSGSIVYDQFDYNDPAQAGFFDRVGQLEGNVASNDPRVNVYGDFVYTPVPPARLHSVWKQRNRSDFMAINSCQWYCSNVGPGCEQDIDRFESNLSRLDLIYEENSTQCEYSVYQIR